MFEPGRYEHYDGWMLVVYQDGTMYLSPNAPLSARLSDIFDRDKWKKVTEQDRV